MIPLPRPAPTTRLTRLCESRTRKVKELGATSEAATEQWRKAEAAKNEIRSLLQAMAPGRRRCMYCLDNLGTDIDHFRPKALFPLLTFEWENHLLACSHCNSNEKRDAYPVDTHQKCLLLNPAEDDPADHLVLDLSSGEYEGRTAKGRTSIKVFGLNRPDLCEGRLDAYYLCCDDLPVWHAKLLAGDLAGADRTATALRREFPDVLNAFQQLAASPTSALALGEELADALTAWSRAAA
ncbi:HNH endonuclease [Streptomyces blattellae]|uniref:HNH endonuclease n=1 Tax=Streptomyces blattellae TaxID=2569855 RepID=UPI0012B7D0B3|nr:HNH endonuclease [Streptomyces blattellae]